jgi:hypothetical protein
MGMAQVAEHMPPSARHLAQTPVPQEKKFMKNQLSLKKNREQTCSFCKSGASKQSPYSHDFSPLQLSFIEDNKTQIRNTIMNFIRVQSFHFMSQCDI